MIRMVLAKCANPKCWRYFPKAVDAAQTMCNDCIAEDTRG
jgi:hypothetical protein